MNLGSTTQDVMAILMQLPNRETKIHNSRQGKATTKAWNSLPSKLMVVQILNTIYDTNLTRIEISLTFIIPGTQQRECVQQIFKLLFRTRTRELRSQRLCLVSTRSRA